MQLAKKTKDFLNSTHKGAETFEVVVIVAILVILIIFMFNVVGQALTEKMQTVADDIAKAGSEWR